MYCDKNGIVNLMFKQLLIAIQNNFDSQPLFIAISTVSLQRLWLRIRDPMLVRHEDTPTIVHPTLITDSALHHIFA